MLERLPETTAEALDALDHAHAQKRAAEVAEVLAIAAAADLYEVDHEAAFHAYEEQVRSRTTGVPGVGEYLALEIGGILGISRVMDGLAVRVGLVRGIAPTPSLVKARGGASAVVAGRV